ncbi:unnamed protein product [Effrenium voratum]|uniref:Uncharacterized protein n=1 Tax=Effrenium voratum TaxID=2562239 RepID=A0AA36MNT3_9DINO|nr:unnamed protein product [Effrenium voratum]CAJ1374458.1 unnamed protein product [Effrenium voratum]
MPVSGTESGSGTGTADTEDSDDMEEMDHTLVNLKQRRGCCRPLCTASCFCHSCYICQFFIWLLVFPLWAKWLVTSPMPTRYWNQDYPSWPVLPTAAGRAVALSGGKRPIEITPIPSSGESCNYSCVASGEHTLTQVAFEVGLTLNDPELLEKGLHVVYPVLLASEDFQDWYVVGDRRHASPMPFWAAQQKAAAGNYLYVTEACTKPPEKAMDLDEVLGGIYVLACVTWRMDHFEQLSKADTLTMDKVGSLCSSAGGVCGWSCGAAIPPNRLPGCSQGRIEVTENSVAGLHTKANFQGTVELQECLEGDTTSCMTSPNNFQHWNCPQCKWDPNPVGSDMDLSLDESASPTRIYQSLPRMKVTLEGGAMPEGEGVLNQPRVVMLSSTVKQTGVWKKLYMQDTGKFELPILANTPTKSPNELEDEDGSTVLNAFTKQAMVLRQPSRVDIMPDWCYGPQGPLYLVACAVNSTLYDKGNDFVNFSAGQKVAPPPFNDRCVAVSGRCGSACQGDYGDTMARCSADGYIEQSALVGQIVQQKNESVACWLFVCMLLLGFAVKAAVLCPGIFRSYPHFRRYDPSLTEELRFVLVCVTSSDESRPLALRSLIGAVGALPAGCSCRYHVAYLDEGHRPQHKAVWTKLCHILAAIPSGSNFQAYEENVRQFFHVWVEETNKMTSEQLKDNLYGDNSQSTVDSLSGQTTLKKLKKAYGWQVLTLTSLEGAIEDLHAELRAPGAYKHKFFMDDLVDWLPTDTNSLALRMHYLARAAPPEDERTLKTQHVAPGTWYYEVPQGSSNEHWLNARQRAVEMVHGIEETDMTKVQIPLRTSRGKAGCLNFASNYFFVYSARVENLYGDSRDTAPALLSLCDARHQFQTDFFHTTVPYFFDYYGDLNRNVGFAQCPKYFPHVQDRADYLDNNDAQFFRLNCMIHNCCGGVSAHGTNSTWMLHRSPDSLVWELAKQRVRDRTTHRKHKEYIEARTFPENCGAEDTAGSLKLMVRGKRSHFISRRLSYGIAKTPTEHLISVQRSIQAHFLLSLQSFCRCSTGFTSLWTTFLAFCCFILSLFILLTKTDLKWQVVEWGWVTEDAYDAVMRPARRWSENVAQWVNVSFLECDQELLEGFILITLQIAVWIATIVLALFVISLITETCKVVQRICLGFGSIWPDEMRWWGRLLIIVSNLTHFLWSWMPLLWIGFNFYNVFASREFHYSPLGMFVFTLILQFLNWGMIAASCMRHSLEASMEANEVVMLTIDNIWRSVQRYYITAPLMIYSMIEGTQDYIRFHCYGQDITFNERDTDGKIAIYLVKYWTLLVEIAAIVAWVYYAYAEEVDEGGLSSLIIVTVIALDVLHPCAYLWVGETKMTRDLASSLSWYQAFTSSGWWELFLHDLILNECVSGVLKWLGPAWMIAMPLLTLLLPYLGVNQAFMLVATVHNR